MIAEQLIFIFKKLIIFLLNVLAVWWLWGYYAPIFDLPVFGYFQTLGLYILIRTLFTTYTVTTEDVPK